MRVANAAEVAGCKDLGTVTGKSAITVGPLARNEAATMGANAIVPKGALEWDQRSYAAFRCEGW